MSLENIKHLPDRVSPGQPGHRGNHETIHQGMKSIVETLDEKLSEEAADSKYIKTVNGQSADEDGNVTIEVGSDGSQINDEIASTDSTWSSEKIDSELDSKSDVGHRHSAADIDGLPSGTGSEIDDEETSLDKTWSSSKIQSEIETRAPEVHEHEIDDIGGLRDELDGKSQIAHEHTISQVTGLQDALDNISTGGGGGGDGWSPPASGIPREILAEDVQDSLDLADTASQPGHTHGAGEIIDLEDILSNVDPSGGVKTVNGYGGPDVVITKHDIGLGEVDNTSDEDKPVSNAVLNLINSLPTIRWGSGPPPPELNLAVDSVYIDVSDSAGLHLWRME